MVKIEQHYKGVFSWNLLCQQIGRWHVSISISNDRQLSMLRQRTGS